MINKDSNLGNLKQAQYFLHSEQARFRNKQDVINKFDSLPLNERQSLFNTYKGCKHHICFINEYAKLKIMGYL